MQQEESDVLYRELAQYRAEQQRIRALVGQIGGKNSARRDRLINSVFFAVIILLFAADLLRHLQVIRLPFPTLFSLEIGILLVSIKIIWMIHMQAKVAHFQFWILHSIEFRLNEVSKQLAAVGTDTRHPRRQTQSGQTP